MRVRGRLFWCYLVLFHMAFSLSLYQVIGFSRGWKLQSPKNTLVHSMDFYICLLWKLIFWEILNLVKKHQHGQVSPGTSTSFTGFQSSCKEYIINGLTYSTQQAARLYLTCHSFHSSHKYCDGLLGLVVKHCELRLRSSRNEIFHLCTF